MLGSARVSAILVIGLLVALSMATPSRDHAEARSETPHPIGNARLSMITDQLSYMPGETVRITLANVGDVRLLWPGVPLDYDVYDEFRRLVRETPWLWPAVIYLEPGDSIAEDWDQQYKLAALDGLGRRVLVPPTGEQVPAGCYRLVTGAHPDDHDEYSSIVPAETWIGVGISCRFAPSGPSGGVAGSHTGG